MILEGFNKSHQAYDKKTATDPVTEVDRNVEKYIQTTVQERFPNHSFLGEETATTTKLSSDKVTWIVDPVDGTANFVHKLPYCAVCIAVAMEGQIVSGVVHAPVLERMYTAMYEFPALLNGKPISVSKVSILSEAAVCTDFGSHRDEKFVSARIENIKVVLRHQTQCIRMLGSCALSMCEVAAGHVDIYYEWGPCIWDFAAARIIVERAGGVVLDPLGSPHDLNGNAVYASNPALASALKFQTMD